MKTTVVTRERLMKACARLGYSISSRKLTDWVQKGLLPPLQQQGRGQGRGKEYFWTERSVISQAIVVSEYLSWTNRTDHTLMFTWFAGYPVPLDRVRSVWSDRQAHNLSALNQQFPDPFDLQERITHSMQRANKKSSNPIPVTLATHVYTALLSSDFDPLDSLTADNEPRLMEEIDSLLNEYGTASKAPIAAIELIKHGLEFIHKNFGPVQRQSMIRSATEQDFLEAQRDWRLITGFLSTIFGYVFMETNEDMRRWRTLWWHLIANIGSSSILLDLALRQSGYRDAINASFMSFLEVYQKIRWTRELAWMRHHRAISSRLVEIIPEFIEKISQVWRPFLH